LDDILGIILLSILYDFSITGVVSAFSIAKNLALICLFSVVTPIFVRYFALTIKKWEKNAAIYAACSALFFAFIATKIGAPELLGGFLAGLGFSSRFLPLSYGLFRHKLQEQIHPVTHFFTPIFFVSIGLKLNLTLIHWGSSFIWVLTGALLFVAIFGKALSGLFAPGGLFSKSLVGIAMIPRGEVGLIFAAMGLSAGIYQEEIYAALILVITLTTLIAPLFLRVLLRLCKKY
jgi:Kef-type K+ transport system membrane component KefB